MDWLTCNDVTNGQLALLQDHLCNPVWMLDRLKVTTGNVPVLPLSLSLTLVAYLLLKRKGKERKREARGRREGGSGRESGKGRKEGRKEEDFAKMPYSFLGRSVDRSHGRSVRSFNEATTDDAR